VSEQMWVPDSVYDRAKDLAKERDTSMKEAVRMMCKEGGYEV